MTIVPAPKTLTKKWHYIERHFSSNFFAQTDSSGPEVFKNRQIFEKNCWEHGSFDFFSGLYTSIKKNLCDNFFKKILQKFFSHICLHIISDFDQILMKNTLSKAICSLKIKKLKITQNLKKCP